MSKKGYFWKKRSVVLCTKVSVMGHLGCQMAGVGVITDTNLWDVCDAEDNRSLGCSPRLNKRKDWFTATLISLCLLTVAAR